MSSSESFTASQLAKILKKSKRTILRWANQYDWPYVSVKVNGGIQRQFIVEAIDKPEEVRMAFMAAEQPGTTKNTPVIMENKGVAVVSPDLTDWQNTSALAWADLLRAYIAEKEKAKFKKLSKGEAAELFIKGYNTGTLLPKPSSCGIESC